MDQLVRQLAAELHANEQYVENVVDMLDGGDTVPFIARYRKERHGSMDDTTLRRLNERLAYLRNLEKRRGEIRTGIAELGRLTESLSGLIEHAATLSELEAIYQPYRQKRRTRASIAKERGLEPLSVLIFRQIPDFDVLSAAETYVNAEKGVMTAEDAVAGACDILAEQIAEDPQGRRESLETVRRSGRVTSALAGKDASVYAVYAEFSVSILKVKDYQILALNRGEKEEILKVSVEADDELLLAPILRRTVMQGRPTASLVRTAAEDGFSRLLFPSLVREIRSELTERASAGAIRNFSLNLKPLLMQPPVRGKVTLGFDPGYRNGCKLAVVDPTGKVLDTAVIYPTAPYSRTEEAKTVLAGLIRRHGVDEIAIGNGTASRESEKFVAELLRGFPGTRYGIVSEAGASVYSASELAAQEFPQYDVNLRSAVSIARRMQDPLAELVKIDPKAIGVGQYQHDIPQAELSRALGAVVEDCVNAVGADVNTASPALLTYIAGLNRTTASNIAAWRDENGPFRSRSELKKVPKLGPKAYEQCAGFLRVPDGAEVLDRTGVHPESYKAARKLLKLCGFSEADVLTGAAAALPDAAAAKDRTALAEACGVGIPTLEDCIRELAKPGRDVREDAAAPVLRPDVTEFADLKPGMTLTGTVRNVTDFGAFVDIGVHRDGLVHISQIADRYIAHPSEVLRVGDVVRVVVLDADEKTKKIQLSIRQAK